MVAEAFPTAALSLAVISLALYANQAFIPLQLYTIATTDNPSTNCKEHCLADRGNRSCSMETLRLLVLYHQGVGISRENGAKAVAIISALELAAEQINNRSDILPCNKLELVHVEADCENTTGTLLDLTRILFPPETLSLDGRVIGAIIQPNCPRLTMQVSAITNRPEIQMVVLHNSDSDIFADRETYPYSLGILGSTQHFIDLSLSLIKRSGWQSLVFLYDSSYPYYYPAILNDLIASVKALNNITINYIPILSPDYYPLDEVKYSKTRIIFAFTSLKDSKRIMCLAYHKELVYPSYQWIFINHRLEDFTCEDTQMSVLQRDLYYNCSCEMFLSKILEGMLLICYQVFTTNHELKTVALFPQNTSFHKFLNLHNQKMSYYGYSPEIFSRTTYYYSMYDAVWVWGLVLNQLFTSHNEYRLIQFENDNKCLGELTLKEFYSIDFEGMSGKITFNLNSGFIDRPVNLYQIVGGYESHLAYTQNTSGVVFLQEFVSIPDKVRIISLPHIGIVTFFLVTHFLQLLVIIALHILSFIYRKTKYVKASSHKLLQPAFCGTYLLIFSMLCYSFYFTHELNSVLGKVICKAVWIWLLPISFTVAQGIIALRAWRLYRIFTHYTNPGKFISDTALIIILLIMVFVDVILAIIRTFVDHMEFTFIEFTPETGQSELVYVDQQCVSSQPVSWIIVYGYKISLLFAMVILSILTHRIPNRTFSTAILQVFSYIYSLVFVIGITLYYLYSFLLDKHSNTDFYIFSAMMSVLSMSFISLILTPPLLPVIQSKLKSLY